MSDKKITIETDKESIYSVINILNIFRCVTEEAHNKGRDVKEELHLLACATPFLIDASKALIGNLEEEFKEFLKEKEGRKSNGE